MSGSNLHENKGVSGASDNTVATAVSGATVWAKLTSSNLASSANPFGGGLFHVRNEQSSGVGGAVLTGGTWNTRVLNTTKTNEITSATLTANQISLPAGSYHIKVNAVSYQSNGTSSARFSQLRLYNITDSAALATGLTTADAAGVTSSGSTPNTAVAILEQRFTIAGTKTIELQQYVTGSAYSEGTPLGVTTEVYCDVLIWKVA